MIDGPPPPASSHHARHGGIPAKLSRASAHALRDEKCGRDLDVKRRDALKRDSSWSAEGEGVCRGHSAWSREPRVIERSCAKEQETHARFHRHEDRTYLIFAAKEVQL